MLLECDHSFCLECIRTWRSHDSGASVSAVRSCPLCRTLSNYIVPTNVWPAGDDQKEDIIEGYRAKVRPFGCHGRVPWW